MTRTFNKLATVAFLAIGAFPMAAARPCAAQPPRLHQGYSHDPSRIVTYARIDTSDLDVRTDAGSRALLRRIELAADAVCGGEDKALSGPQKRDYRDCRADAISGAVSTMGSPKLKMLARGGRRDLLVAR